MTPTLQGGFDRTKTANPAPDGDRENGAFAARKGSRKRVERKGFPSFLSSQIFLDFVRVFRDSIVAEDFGEKTS